MATILVVDDEEPVRDLVSKIVLKDGHDVVVAADGQEACDLYAKSDIDLIITDLVMPEKNGIQMIMDLKNQTPDLKVVAISGGSGFTGDIDLLSVAKLLGAKHIIRNPFGVDDIRNAVNDTLGI